MAESKRRLPDGRWICKGCGPKPSAEFPLHKGRPRSYCKVCWRAYVDSFPSSATRGDRGKHKKADKQFVWNSLLSWGAGR